MHFSNKRTTLALTAASLLAPASSRFTCRPGQYCWPSLTQWQQFNETVNGRLKVSEPTGSVCFPSSPNFDSQACADVQANYANSTYRVSHYGELENANWESCGTANCYPGIFAPQGETCSLGRFSALHVNVETPDDIAATLAFTKEHDIRIVLTNTGHDYMGRSAAANTLSLRTYNMKNMSFEPSFTPKNCPAAGTKTNVGIIGAGVTADEAIAFFSQHGMMVPAGGCGTVGIAGGFAQGGGHGPLSQTIGLVADWAIEFDVMTTDGVFRTINECNDPDLFWAMRGGGGQSYAILVNYKMQLHATTQWSAWTFSATINVDPNEPDVTKNDVYRDVLTHIASEQLTWSKNHITGYSSLQPSAITFIEMLPTNDDALGTLKSLTSDFNSWLTSNPAINITLNNYDLLEDQPTFYKDEAATLSNFVLAGLGVNAASRLVTTPDFETPDKIDALVDGVLNGMEAARQVMGGELGTSVALLLLKTGASNTPDTQGATSVNPAWRDTHWHMVPAGIYLPGSDQATIDTTLAASRAALSVMKQPLAVQASYLNEADGSEEDWQILFFGAHYDKLLAVKQKYDPESVINCWKCVGFLGEEDPMYSCYSADPVPSTPYPFTML